MLKTCQRLLLDQQKKVASELTTSIKKSGLKRNDCLESFDAKISGLVKGWVFVKVAFGEGGHQDNVFSEAHDFVEWADKYGKDDQLYIVLVDTDLNHKFKELKQKPTKPNTIVCNHVEFQRFIFDLRLKLKKSEY